MLAVIFDVETTYVTVKGEIPEIVEIGACKVNLNAYDPGETGKDCFQCYTFPEIKGSFGKKTLKFIGLKEEDLGQVVPFREGYDRFMEWIGSELVYFCSWGVDDRKILLEHCKRFDLPQSWLNHYHDIQRPISQLLVKRNQMKLKDAIEQAGIEKEGRLHSALVDAINTTKLFVRYYDQLNLRAVIRG